ncbi:MAG: copper homeostasis protein CutC [Homoserinimonas sp.]
MTLLEICLDDIEGAATAESHGAGRIELCANLSEGGTTPSIGTVKAVLGSVSTIGVQVLIRQRPGDFVFSPAEVTAMCADIEAIRALEKPASVTVGFVIGALDTDNTIDVEATRRMLGACGDAPVTFHKAFDHTPDLDVSFETLVSLGIPRVLTSGGPGTALDGAENLAALVARSAGRVIILAAGGIRAHNVARILAVTGVPEVHLRAGEPVQRRGSGQPTAYETANRAATSAAVIDDVLAQLGRTLSDD